MTFALRPSLVVAAGVLAVSTLLAGCSTTPAPVETSAAPATEPTATPSPSATPTQSPETGDTIPARVFDGDCGAVFSTGDLRDILGARVTFAEAEFADALELAQAGGIGCIWRTGDYSTLVNVDVLPQASIRSTAETAECATSDDLPGWRCEIEHEQSGIRISGFFSLSPSFPKSKADEALDAVIAAFDSTATPAQAEPAPIPASGAWVNPVDCPAIAAAVDVRSIFNSTPGLEYYASGGDAFPSPARVELWGDTYGLGCTWGTNKELSAKQLASGMTQNFDITVLGGAAWAQDELEKESSATDVQIDGLDRVIRTKSTYGYRFAVIDGPNLLRFGADTADPGNAGEAAAAIVAFLDGQ